MKERTHLIEADWKVGPVGYNNVKRNRADPGRQSRLFCLFGLGDCRHYESCLVYSVLRIGYKLIATPFYMCALSELPSVVVHLGGWLTALAYVFCDVQHNFV